MLNILKEIGGRLKGGRRGGNEIGFYTLYCFYFKVIKVVEENKGVLEQSSKDLKNTKKDINWFKWIFIILGIVVVLLVIVVVVMFFRSYYISQMVIGEDEGEDSKSLLERCQESFISIEGLDADINQVNITLNGGEVDKIGIMINGEEGDYLDIHHLNPGDSEMIISDDFDKGDEIAVFSVIGDDYVCGNIDFRVA